MTPEPIQAESPDRRLVDARAEARRLLESKPWRDDPEWQAGCVVHNTSSGAFVSYLMIAILVALATVCFIAYPPGDLTGLMVGAFLLALAGVLIFARWYYRSNKSVCLLRRVPTRVGEAFEAEVQVRLRVKPDSPVRVSLFNKVESRDGWRGEQSVGLAEIRIAEDGTASLPVSIPIPAAARARHLGPHWVLEVHAKMAGPDYKASFVVPVYDLADLPEPDDTARKETRPGGTMTMDHAAASAMPAVRGFDVAVGVVVGGLGGFALGFGFGESQFSGWIKGLFQAIFLGSVLAFLFLGEWRKKAFVALRRLDDPQCASAMRNTLILLSLLPWAAAAIVLWFAWLVGYPLFALAWGLGLLLCAYPSPFASPRRNPVLDAGLALTVASLAAMLL